MWYLAAFVAGCVVGVTATVVLGIAVHHSQQADSEQARQLQEHVRRLRDQLVYQAGVRDGATATLQRLDEAHDTPPNSNSHNPAEDALRDHYDTYGGSDKR